MQGTQRSQCVLLLPHSWHLVRGDRLRPRMLPQGAGLALISQAPAVLSLVPPAVRGRSGRDMVPRLAAILEPDALLRGGAPSVDLPLRAEKPGLGVCNADGVASPASGGCVIIIGASTPSELPCPPATQGAITRRVHHPTTHHDARVTACRDAEENTKHTHTCNDIERGPGSGRLRSEALVRRCQWLQ